MPESQETLDLGQAWQALGQGKMVEVGGANNRAIYQRVVGPEFETDKATRQHEVVLRWTPGRANRAPTIAGSLPAPATYRIYEPGPTGETTD